MMSSSIWGRGRIYIFNLKSFGHELEQLLDIVMNLELVSGFKNRAKNMLGMFVISCANF